jgi:hypothetical protein
MVPQLIVQIVIALLVAGFLFWAVRLVIGLIPLEPILAQVINALLIIAAVAIVLFYVIIPVLHVLAGVTLSIGGIR